MRATGRPVHRGSVAELRGAAEGGELDDGGAAADVKGPPTLGESPEPVPPRALILPITRDTRISDILRVYGDIAIVMEELGVRRVPGYSFRAFLARSLTVERAARIHRVPVDELIARLREAVERSAAT
jgi:hypothetical protein